MRSIENLTSCAVKSEPSWNFTPRRSLNSHVVSLIARQLSASRGSSSSPSPDQTRVSYTCLSASAWVPVAVKCGSIESGPPRTPMVRVCASAEAHSTVVHNTPAKRERMSNPPEPGAAHSAGLDGLHLMSRAHPRQYLLEPMRDRREAASICAHATKLVRSGTNSEHHARPARCSPVRCRRADARAPPARRLHPRAAVAQPLRLCRALQLPRAALQHAALRLGGKALRPRARRVRGHLQH